MCVCVGRREEIFFYIGTSLHSKGVLITVEEVSSYCYPYNIIINVSLCILIGPF